MAGALLAVLDVPRFDCTPGWRAVDHTYSGCLETKGLAVSTQDSMAARGRASAPAYEQQSPGSATQQSQQTHSAEWPGTMRRGAGPRVWAGAPA